MVSSGGRLLCLLDAAPGAIVEMQACALGPVLHTSVPAQGMAPPSCRRSIGRRGEDGGDGGA